MHLARQLCELIVNELVDGCDELWGCACGRQYPLKLKRGSLEQELQDTEEEQIASHTCSELLRDVPGFSMHFSKQVRDMRCVGGGRRGRVSVLTQMKI